ncbi:hypothetical protein ACFYY1_15685 [Streptomyces sp. NPDC001890]|uniref:hypothetical protein n=1 Tax=Streptomyces sp. NPDC001890 TaxID=3364620 RepID=UPI00369B8830
MMRNSAYGEAMPVYLRQATYVNVVGAVDFLQEVLRYSAPDRASHGWARMCMYRASDAMDTLGRLTGVIAAHVVENGMSRHGIRRILRVEEECARTDRPSRLEGLSLSKQELFYMPSPLCEQVHKSVAQVVLRLHQVVKEGDEEHNKEWFGHCLYQLSLAMDDLGLLNRAIAAFNAGVLSRETLSRYQHLFQQRSRADMPDAEDSAYLAGLLGRNVDGEHRVWNVIGRAQAERRQLVPEIDSHDGRVLRMLAGLDRALQPLRWNDASGNPLGRTQDTATAFLNALTAFESEDDDYPPLYWLDRHAQAEAAAAAHALFGGRSSPGTRLAEPRTATGRCVANEG